MLEYIKAVGTGLFIAFMVTQLVCLGEGNGTSMLPLLRDGDYFIMSKIVKEVERGDVVGVEDINQNKLLVKRIVATEGDFVEVTPTGQFYLNGELQIEDYIYEQD
jgi:signal peptidase I